MLTFNKLKWSDAFSYGENNEIDFRKHPLVQIVAKNGSGKTSIGLILEEVLFNKNSKNIKKSDILNRYSKKSKYRIAIDFEKDGNTYTVDTVRGTTQSVTLTCNGVDISEHTSTGTYKAIEKILGYNHKTFTQVCNVSDPFCLEFLTTTDSKRKEFLIDLLKLSEYTDIYNSIKADAKILSDDIESVESKINTFKSWIASNSLNSYDEITLKDDNLAVPIELINKQIELQSQIAQIDQINSKIRDNLVYKQRANNMPDFVDFASQEELSDINSKLAVVKSAIAAEEKIIKNTRTDDKCYACGQHIDNTQATSMVKASLDKKVELERERDVLKEQHIDLTTRVSQYKDYLVRLADWENTSAKIDKTLPDQLLEKDTLLAKLTKVSNEIKNIKNEIAEIASYNSKAVAHNAKMASVKSQIDLFKKNLLEAEQDKSLLMQRANKLAILQKAMSPTGFIAYKLEYLVKDLEAITNQYLVEMSDGRFQISFVLNSSDKLNVVIVDNGVEIDIASLSNGELSRVNISTLLAIRKLMQGQSLNNVTTNLLILDETIESIDADGKEKLIELLLSEEGLNTILISHGFNHPLLHQIHVEKNNGISKLAELW